MIIITTDNASTTEMTSQYNSEYTSNDGVANDIGNAAGDVVNGAGNAVEDIGNGVGRAVEGVGDAVGNMANDMTGNGTTNNNGTTNGNTTTTP